MINVSSAFKTAMKNTTRQMHAYLISGQTRIDDTNDLQSLEIVTKGDIGQAVMRTATVKYVNNYNFIGTYMNLGMGVVVAGGSTEWLDYGLFRTDPMNPPTQDKTSGQFTMTLYDQMFEAQVAYDLTPTYPLTVKQFLQAICTRFNWVLLTQSFPNDAKIITSELYSNLNLSFLDVLTDIAQATASIIYFNTQNQLVVKQVGNTVLDTLPASVLNTLEIDDQYGPITSVVLARQPQGDEIVQNAPSM